MFLKKLVILLMMTLILPLTAHDGKQCPETSDAMTLAIQVAQAKIRIAEEMGYVAPEGDSDGDGLLDEEEYQYGTDPYSPDSDNDRWPDGYEVANGTEPLAFDNEEWLERIAIAGDDVAALFLPNPACVIASFNPKTCAGTCTGKCLFVVPCFWTWDPVQWAVDKLLGAPCPGWTCDCP